MKLRNLMTVGLLMAGFGAAAQAQSYYGGGYNQPGRYAEQRYERQEIGRDLRQREALERRVEFDRRAVEHERWELRRSPWFAEGHEWRELRAAQERLECDVRALRAFDRDVNHDFNDYGRARYHDRW